MQHPLIVCQFEIVQDLENDLKRWSPMDLEALTREKATIKQRERFVGELDRFATWDQEASRGETGSDRSPMHDV